MPIETICEGCGRRLRVPDQHAGQQARCPACRRVYTVPRADPVARADHPTQPWQPRHDSVKWRLRIPDGQVFGPVEKRELDQWLAEGRISLMCQVQSEASAEWMPAAELYPVLLQSAQATDDLESRGVPRYSEFDPDALRHVTHGHFYSTPAPRRYLAAHRGGLMLGLGLLGLCCGIFGVLAWVLSSHDLHEMRAGRMDPRGHSLTLAGCILGIVSTVLWGLRFLGPVLVRML